MVNYSVFPLKFPFVFTKAYGKPIPRTHIHQGLDNLSNNKVSIATKNIKGDI